MFDLAQIPRIETRRLVLRRFEESDLDGAAAMLGDSEVMRFIGEGRAMTRAETWRAMAQSLGHWGLRGFGPFIAEEKATRSIVGRIGLIHPEGWPGIELGWTLARPHWGNGFATEGAAAIRDYAFETMGLPKLISLIDPANVASIRVAERIGERFERTTELLGKRASVYAIEAAARPGR